MGIKLHYHPLSTYSRRVRIASAEKQIPRRVTPLLGAAPVSPPQRTSSVPRKHKRR